MISDDCIPCTSYNNDPGTDILVDFCDPLVDEYNPIVYVDVDTCFPLPDAVRPGPIADLDTLRVTDREVRLRWTASGDDSITGRPTDYVLKYSRTLIDDVSFALEPDSVIIPATRDPGGTETVRVSGLTVHTDYWFAIKARDEGGNFSALSNVISARTRVGGPLANVIGPAIVSLVQPSRLPVEFYWQGVEGGVSAPQTIKIYDLTGAVQRVIPVGLSTNGIERWDGLDDTGHILPCGIYFAQLFTGGTRAKTRVVLVK